MPLSFKRQCPFLQFFSSSAEKNGTGAHFIVSFPAVAGSALHELAKKKMEQSGQVIRTAVAIYPLTLRNESVYSTFLH